MTVDPVAALDAILRRAVIGALGVEHDPQVRRSTRADLQADLVPQLAKPLGIKPDELAGRIVAAVPANELIERIVVAPGGFLNVRLRDAWLAAAVMRIAADDRLGVPLGNHERVVIDYSSPNIAKELHVGHLRSTVIGDALARVLEFRGHTVIRQNHIGDWGTPFGMLIEHLVDVGEGDALHALDAGQLSTFYRAARAKFDADPGFADRARRRVVGLQAGDAETLAWWRVLVAQTTRYMHGVYARLGVTLRDGDICGESLFNDRLAPLAQELEGHGGVISEGALCVFAGGFLNREGNPLPLMVRKRDGGFGYAATDLAAIRYRLHELKATRLIYVVGAAQAQHLAMVFAAARELGWLTEPRVEHVGFGLVLGDDKKKLASRDGTPPRLGELIDDAIAAAATAIEALEANRKVAPLDEPTRCEVARMVGVGSIKYADLSADRTKDYVFNLARMVRFEGNTAGYAQYVHARVRALFDKAPAGAAPGPIALADPREHALALQLASFGSAVASVEHTLQPHHLVGYTFALATAFTAFYEHCPILRSDIAPAVRDSRLALAEVAGKTIARALGLLGIEAPDRM